MNRQELDNVLTSRFKNNFELNNYTVVIWGGGNTTLLYQKCFERENIIPDYYADNNIDKNVLMDWRGEKKLIINADKLLELNKDKNIKPIIVFICSANLKVVQEIKKQLNGINIENYTIDEYIFWKNRKKLLTVYDILEDDLSKKVYSNVILSRVLNCEIDEEIVNLNSYFYIKEFSKINKNQVFCDLGAYTGDTVEKYIISHSGAFKKIYAFEPDKSNYNCMKQRLERLKKEWIIDEGQIELVNAGIDSIDTAMVIKSNTNGLGASFHKYDIQSDKISVFKMDTFFKDKRVDFIKADIESYEYDMLLGAKQLINKYNPLLAICIYHNASDIYDIPLLIRKINPKYRLKVMQHSYEYLETVLYAY